LSSSSTLLPSLPSLPMEEDRDGGEEAEERWRGTWKKEKEKRKKK